MSQVRHDCLERTRSSANIQRGGLWMGPLTLESGWVPNFRAAVPRPRLQFQHKGQGCTPYQAAVSCATDAMRSLLVAHGAEQRYKTQHFQKCGCGSGNQTNGQPVYLIWIDLAISRFRVCLKNLFAKSRVHSFGKLFFPAAFLFEGDNW